MGDIVTDATPEFLVAAWVRARAAGWTETKFLTELVPVLTGIRIRYGRWPPLEKVCEAYHWTLDDDGATAPTPRTTP